MFYLSSGSKVKGLKEKLGKLNLGANVYTFWKEKNNRCFMGEQNNLESVIKFISTLVHDKACEFSKVVKTRENKSIAKRWFIPMCIFK